ncbi:MAG: type II secretion system F family protein [Candidatus Nanopelagicaceae bacterium]
MNKKNAKFKSDSKSTNFLTRPITNPFKGSRGNESKIDKAISAQGSSREKRKFWEIEFGKSVPDAVLLQVTRQLGSFTSAGVSILDTIELLLKSVKHKRMNETLRDLSEKIRNGSSISQAVLDHPKVFPKYYASILEASERSGDLATTFDTLTFYIERDYTSKRTVKSAMYYPVLLIGLSILAIFTLSTVVLPKFEVFFKSLNAKLPLATRLLLDFSRFMAEYWWAISLAILASIAIFYRYRSSQVGRLSTDRLAIRLPFVGKIVELVLLERFTRILGSLAGAGVPLPDALSLASKSLGNVVYRQAIEKISDGVMQGRGFVDPLEETNVFPEEAIQIFRVGEQSGRLIQQLDFASAYYAKEVDYRLKNASTLIEPVVLAVVGGGVGFVAVALVSAMYGIYSSTALGG